MQTLKMLIMTNSSYFPCYQWHHGEVLPPERQRATCGDTRLYENNIFCFTKTKISYLSFLYIFQVDEYQFSLLFQYEDNSLAYFFDMRKYAYHQYILSIGYY